MALHPCPECGEQISDTAKSCPRCGFRMPKTSFIEKAKKAIAGFAGAPLKKIPRGRERRKLSEIKMPGPVFALIIFAVCLLIFVITMITTGPWE